MKESKRHGTSSLLRPTAVRFDGSRFHVELSDGRVLGVPLMWFPRLLTAKPEQLENYELSPLGIHWEELDEDISIAGLLAGRGDQSRRVQKAAE